ncbi:enoyl-CoA hydratase-related protein, partial [Bordetella hinzii]|nr:enoyl-CoA hydratase-related protein [Bordetella hinzii]
MAFLQIEREGGIVTATMNQPETRNALTGNTAVDEFVALCADIRRDAGVKVLIITAAGPIFSSGGNVKDMRRFFDEAVTPESICEEYRQGIQRIPLALHALDVPVIAAINGPAIGAGLDLACMCDIRIAADTATFAESFVRVGIVPGDGGAWLLPRAVGMA